VLRYTDPVSRDIRRADHAAARLSEEKHQCPNHIRYDPPVSHPHHAISDLELIGEGQGPMPGELSLARHSPIAAA
jgi:predicted ATPase with chaperone activity